MTAGAASASPPSAATYPAFTHADLEALRLTQRLSDLGFVDADDESALVRTLGRSFARLAEWQMRLLARMIDIDSMELDELRTIMDEVVPAVETLQSYVWRRHTLAVAARLLLAADERRRRPDRRAPPGRGQRRHRASASPTSSTTPGRAAR